MNLNFDPSKTNKDTHRDRILYDELLKGVDQVTKESMKCKYQRVMEQQLSIPLLKQSLIDTLIKRNEILAAVDEVITEIETNIYKRATVNKD